MTGFVFQDEYLERLKKLSDQELGRIVRALSGYHATGEEPELEGLESVIFGFIRADIDRIDRQYHEKSATNRANRLASAGSVRKKQRILTNDDEKQRTLTKHDETAQDKDKVKDKVKEKDKEKKNDDDNDDNVRARGKEENGAGTETADPVILAAKQELTGMTPAHYQDLADFRKELKDEVILEAVNEAVAHSARSWAYVRSILQQYIRDGIRTAKEARAQRGKNPMLHAVRREERSEGLIRPGGPPFSGEKAGKNREWAAGRGAFGSGAPRQDYSFLRERSCAS